MQSCWNKPFTTVQTIEQLEFAPKARLANETKYGNQFVGNYTANRVTLSTGRDLVLEPKQQGEPLNYFLNPYAEADGKSVKTEKTWSYRDLD